MNSVNHDNLIYEWTEGWKIGIYVEFDSKFSKLKEKWRIWDLWHEQIRDKQILEVFHMHQDELKVGIQFDRGKVI